ncbi:peptidoglycan-binding domain-containing protein [Thetidibacter halocola]|uniref:Peptidoglycan-binding protein n=1 Tax=Thetidibacter halocola TaxID=2827239 RepID=A0A8J7WG07_9RHOB|nr:peptidoglycan-binding domain-containing protein [Thetidibacter halocola]MBS0124628.1 peptidoglycan-binding protein [Thetidibacter halocola]
MTRRLALTLTGALLGTASPLVADGDALVIANARASGFDTLFSGARLGAAATSLRNAGLSVAERTGADAAGMRAAFAEFVAGLAPGDDPVIVLLSGDVVHGAAGAWLLPAGMQAPDAARAMTEGLSLDAVLSVLAGYPGRAVLLLGEGDADLGAEPFLRAGPGALDIPQGVTVLRGPAVDVARLAVGDLAQPDLRLIEAARRRELTVEGYAPDDLVLLRAADVVIAPPQPLPPPQPQADELAWAIAQRTDSPEGYRSYLDRFPGGLHADAARQRLAAIEADPFFRERRAEEALGLDREARRDIQRDLTLLGYSTRGIDGIFGRGTRSAIDRWQADNGLPRSSFLDRAQVDRLDRQAAQRADELEEEARIKREETERRDRIAWESVTGPNDESGLRRYLQQFPDGLFADRAAELLAEIEARRADRAAERDRRAWAQAEAAGTEAAYRAYLAEFPDGAFRRDAEDRLRRLTRPDPEEDARAAARRAEEALNLNAITRRLVEARLDQLGLRPGDVDGRFDDRTRRAIRRFQQDRGLVATGYLDQDTVVRLLAVGILRQ